MKTKLFIAGILALSFAGCGGGGGGTIAEVWYNVFGANCGGTPKPGCNFYVNGDKIKLDYYGYYEQVWNPATEKYDDVWTLPALTYYSNYNVAGFGNYTGWGYLAPSGIFFTDFGTALNSKEKRGRDVITNAAAAEKMAIQKAASSLQARYGLSKDSSTNIAVTLNEWAVIGKTRKRTEADVAAFTKRLTGLKIEELNAALNAAKKGDTATADQAISRAAAHWSTSPDTMKAIVKDWFQKQN